MKKVLHFIVLVSAIITATITRAEIFGGNDCGENCSWSLDTQTGVLTISGEGAMTDYYWRSAPWYSKRSSIDSVQISEGITSIGQCAFDGSTNLSSVSIPSSVTSIGNYAFIYNNLTSVDIPNTVTSIGHQAFMGNDLTSITIPDSVTSIGVQAFDGNDFETVTVPDSVKTLYHGAFSGNPNLKEITVSPSQLGAEHSGTVSRDAFSDECAQGQLSPSLCQKIQAFFDKNPNANRYAYSVSIFDNMDISNVLIYCRGEISACHEAMSDLNYGTGPNQKGTYKLAQKQTDGSSKIFESSDKVYYKGKRIYTIDEANTVTGTKNRISIKYR
ncbi:MAG: leucine-rich repeat domain-containing protein [Alphaproteobacteria bacterium]|nr:leucine-rich repeat domain-containing protein [Alphaproteobacteria bacterium]